MNAHGRAGTVPYAHARWWARPKEGDRPPLHWHVASRAFAAAMWAAPRRYRFRAAVAFARAFAPLARRTIWYREQSRLRIDGPREVALHHALSIMSHSGALFDLDLRVEGAEKLDAAIGRGRGVLIISPHALLSLSLFRYLYDTGRVPAIVSMAPFAHIYGTRLLARAVQPSPVFMIGLRGVLREGGIVCAMIDCGRPGGARTVEFQTPEGPMYVSDALIRLAKRCDASVVFTSVRTDERRGVVLTFGEPEGGAEAGVRATTEDFVAFVRAHVAAVASSSSRRRSESVETVAPGAPANFSPQK